MGRQTMALGQRLRRWIDRTAWATCMLMLIALMGALSPALAAKRIDLHDADGRHIGHAIVDRRAGRVDYYDLPERRIGWGIRSASAIAWICTRPAVSRLGTPS